MPTDSVCIPSQCLHWVLCVPLIHGWNRDPISLMGWKEYYRLLLLLIPTVLLWPVRSARYGEELWVWSLPSGETVLRPVRSTCFPLSSEKGEPLWGRSHCSHVAHTAGCQHLLLTMQQMGLLGLGGWEGSSYLVSLESQRMPRYKANYTYTSRSLRCMHLPVCVRACAHTRTPLYRFHHYSLILNTRVGTCSLCLNLVFIFIHMIPGSYCVTKFCSLDSIIFVWLTHDVCQQTQTSLWELIDISLPPLEKKKKKKRIDLCDL